jgi:hypothetical protein
MNPLLPKRDPMPQLMSQIRKQWGQDPISLDFTGIEGFWCAPFVADVLSYLWRKNPTHPSVKIKPPLSNITTLTISLPWKDTCKDYMGILNHVQKEIFDKLNNETITKWGRGS